MGTGDGDAVAGDGEDGLPEGARGGADADDSAAVVPPVAEGEGWGPGGVQAASADSPAPVRSSRAMVRRLGGVPALSAVAF